MGVQVVHDQNNFLHMLVLVVQQILHEMGPSRF